MKLNEKQQKKLLKTLGKWGIEEEKALKVIDDLNSESEEPELEAETPEGAEAEPTPEPIIDEAQPEPSPEAPAEPEPAPEPSPEPAPELGEPSLPEPETAPETPAPAAEPLPDPRIDEVMKTLDATNSKIDSLIESLEQAGVLTQKPSAQPVGMENQPIAGGNPAEESMGDTLARLNKGRIY